jgi:tetratricopeptide (TPR) repeat protein
MHLSRFRLLMLRLAVICPLISGCGPPVTSRLVTVELLKAPEVDMQRVKIIGVLPFKSPDRTLGLKLAEETARGLDREPFLAKMVQTSSVPETEGKSLLELGKEAKVVVLLLGEITEHSVQASKDTISMIAYPQFGAVDPAELTWVGIRGNPSVDDAFYYRLESMQKPNTVQISITKSAYSLTIHLRLVEVESGATLWEETIGRHLELISLPESPVETDAGVRRIQTSIVDEVVARLRPQKTSVQRILRAPRFTMDPRVAKLIRQGIKAAEREDWKETEGLFLQALAQASEECSITGNLGVVYERSGRLFEAVAAYERAYRCQPRDPTYRYYSDDLQTAFVPELDKEDLPTLVLGVREDGVIYLDGGKSRHRHPGDVFVLYHVQLWRDQDTAKITRIKEVEFASGKIVEVRQRMSLGRLLLLDPRVEVSRGDLIRFEGR